MRHEVWLTHKNVDPFDQACVRASQGALFYLPYHYGRLSELATFCAAERLCAPPLALGMWFAKLGLFWCVDGKY